MNVEQIKQFVQTLAAAVKGLRLYSVDHPANVRQIELMQNGLFTLLQHKKSVRIGLLEGTLFVDDHLFIQEFQAAEEISQLLGSLELAGLEMTPGVSADDLRTLMDLLDSGAVKGDALVNALSQLGVKSIRAIAADETEEDRQPRKVYRKALKVVDQIFRDVRMGEIPSSQDAIKVVKNMAQLTITEPHAMQALSMLKDYDNYTFTHSVNVSVISLAVGRACDVNDEQLRVLGLGGLLHDLGKLRIDVKIITKPGTLTLSELHQIKRHPYFGAEIISQMEGVTDEVMNIVIGHHLRYDRSGYPSDAAGRALSPLVDMATIADTYDAMTTLRSYQRPFTPRRATARLKEMSGSSLHPDYTQKFIESLGPYPVGSLVRLDNNEIGLVTKVDPQEPSLADVKIIFGHNGALLKEPFSLHLGPGQPREIVAEVDPHLKGIDVTDFFDYE